MRALWSCDITKHGIYNIGQILANLSDRDFWFKPQNVLNLCGEHFSICGVIKGISCHRTRH